MGKRGPAPKPTNLRLLHGDRPDRINTTEPQPADGDVKPPTWLSAKAKRVWRRLAPDLIARGVLTPWDVDSFAIFCDAMVQYRQASELVAKSGVIIRGRKDAAVKNPAMQIVRDTSQTVRSYAQQFGLTPSARSGLSFEEDHVDAGERLLS